MPYVYIVLREQSTSTHLSGQEQKILLTSNFIEKTENPAKAGKGVNQIEFVFDSK